MLLKKSKDGQPFCLQNVVNKIRVFVVTNFLALSVRVVFVAHRSDDIQTTGSLAESFHQRLQEVPVEKAAQPSCGVRMPGRSFLRISGQVAGLGVVPRSTCHQLLSQRKW